LERSGWLAMVFGYGLLLVVTVQLFQQQRNQRQLVTMQRAEQLLRSNVAVAGQPQELQRLLNRFSGSTQVLWGRPVGQQSAPLLPEISVPLRQQAEQLVEGQASPQLFRDRTNSYLISSRVMDLSGNDLKLYLLEDVSEEVAFQRQLNALLFLATALAALVSVLLNRYGVAQALRPLISFGNTLDAFSAKPLQQQHVDPEQLPLELKPLAFALNALRDQRTDSRERQQQFASSMSHELRTPITLIGGYTRRLLRRGDNLSDDQRDQLLIVQDETRRLAQVVSDLVAISRAEIGSQQLELQPLCIADLVQESIASLEQSMQQRVVVVADEGIDLNAIQAFADRASLQQCLVHVIDNACKYSPAASAVEISCSLDAERVVVRVRDHGPGIPAAEREAVFERFRRGSNSAGIPGSGIGLALVRMLADQMGGSVSIDDADGEGAVVALTLRRWMSPEPDPLRR
jgi:hypothetical protein